MHSLEYDKYLQSAEWRTRRHQKIRSVGYCEKCWAASGLEVHHLSYDRLGHEPDSDLQVLCHACHMKADEERVEQRVNDQWNRGLETYMTKKYGKYWDDDVDRVSAAEEFDDWLASKEDDGGD